MEIDYNIISYEGIVSFTNTVRDFTQLNLLIAICVIGIYCILFKQSSDDAELGGTREIFMVLLGIALLFIAYISVPLMTDLNQDYIYTEFFANWGTELLFIAPWVMIKIARLMAINEVDPNDHRVLRNSLILQLVMLLAIVGACVFIVLNIETLSTNYPNLKLILLNLAVEGFTFPTTLLLIITVELIIYVRSTIASKHRLHRAQAFAIPVMLAFYVLLAIPFLQLAYAFEPLTYATIGGLLTIVIFVESISTANVMMGAIPFRYIFYVVVFVIVFYLLSGLSQMSDLINIGFSAELLGALIPFFLITRRERQQLLRHA